jgi:hypothetical protein
MTERAAAKLTETWARAASITARQQPDYVVQAIRTMQAERHKVAESTAPARAAPGGITGTSDAKHD